MRRFSLSNQFKFSQLRKLSFSFKIVSLALLCSLCFFCQNPKPKDPNDFSPKSYETKNVSFKCPFPIEMGTIYGNGISHFDKTLILFEIKQLLLDLCEGHFIHLVSFIDKETGLFVDAKGYWTLGEVKVDLKDPEGYFALYYFDKAKLDQKKGSIGNLTIREVFTQAGPVFIDFYIGSKEEVELKFRFPDQPKLERYLINPSFIKLQNSWYLHRMF